ncbi:2'-5' RNA ligase family protein [Plantactinospora sp. GCM10030261]|uniref:2'-5' RNA ligase family protein n=1 Tax=Plantactinospora sp. GCM10030261 TaxID=3273420 RepID=UPI003616917E
MRLFVALYPPPAALDDLAAELARLRIGAATARGVNVRLPARDTIHITLAFLGDVDDDRLPRVRTALGRVAERWSAQRSQAVCTSPATLRESGGSPSAAPLIRLGGGGRFGRGRFTILWVGLAGEVEPVRRLTAGIRRELRAHRLPYDQRPWRPHLTVARPGDRIPSKDVTADRAALDEYQGPLWPVTEMVLVRSHLGPRPVYHRIDAWPLGS